MWIKITLSEVQTQNIITLLNIVYTSILLSSMILRLLLLSSLNPTVLAIYSKSRGKAGKHSWVSDSSNVAAVSNIPVQLFDHILGVVPGYSWWANFACEEVLFVTFLRIFVHP